jgi:hypothetical protein
MLINYDPTVPLYIIGQSAVAVEIYEWVSEETAGEVKIIDPSRADDLPDHSQCMIGFMTVEYRVKFLLTALTRQWSWPTLIHPDSYFSKSSTVGNGSIISPKSTIGNNVVLGDFCLVGQQVNIGHGTKIGKNVVISPATIFGGSTTVGSNVTFGQMCSIKDKISIGSDVNFFMNSIVTKNIEQCGSYYGNKKASRI